MKKNIKIDTPFITLQSLIKFSGISVTGGEAKAMVESGLIMVNGLVCTLRGKKLYPGDTVEGEGFDPIVIEGDRK